MHGAHTKNGIQFLKLEDLDSQHIQGIWIPGCLGNRNDNFFPFMPPFTFIISKIILLTLDLFFFSPNIYKHFPNVFSSFIYYYTKSTS